jgi:RHS repeat-associated protein
MQKKTRLKTHTQLIDNELAAKGYNSFGMLMSGRSFSSDGYRYGFNGKEKDDEVSGSGNQYDYGFRIYNSRIGRFLSVDPLTKSYPWYTPYQFAGNMPIWAIDLDGLEEKITVFQEDVNGNDEMISSITYEDIENYGPLGNGMYSVHLKTDGSFTEHYSSGEGNSIPSFSSSNVKQARWYGDGKYSGFEDRLNARLIEKVTENVFINLGYDASQVRKDVQILQSDDYAFKGRFATFREGTANKYTKDWNPATPSSAHFSETGRTSNEIGGSDVLIKYYDGVKSSTVPNQIGLVRDGIFDHGTEYLRTNEYTGDQNVNIGVENAKRVKSDQEKKP